MEIARVGEQRARNISIADCHSLSLPRQKTCRGTSALGTSCSCQMVRAALRPVAHVTMKQVSRSFLRLHLFPSDFLHQRLRGHSDALFSRCIGCTLGLPYTISVSSSCVSCEAEHAKGAARMSWRPMVVIMPHISNQPHGVVWLW